MKKKLFVGGVILLWVVTGIFLTFSLNKEDEEAVAQTFGRISSEEMTGCFYAEGSVEGEYLTGAEQEAFLKEIARKLGVESECEIETERKNAFQKMTLKKQSAAAEVIMEITTYEVEVEENVIETKQYFFMELMLNQYMNQIVPLKEEVEKILEEYPVECDYGMEFEAGFTGLLSLNEKNRIADWLLKELDADVVNEKKSNEFYTIYAYTPYIAEYELVDRRPINVNLAFHYDEERNMTHLHMATPYMYSEY